MNTTRESQPRWFVKPLNKETNETISNFLDGDPSLCQQRKDAKGKSHNVWECTPEQIRMFESNAALKFRTMNNQGRDRPLRNFPFKFLQKTKNKKTAAK